MNKPKKTSITNEQISDESKKINKTKPKQESKIITQNYNQSLNTKNEV